MSNEVVVLWRKEEAYIQLVMHLYKYATEAVCGVLLGTINYTEDKYSSTITVDECLPLSHINLKSNPMLQVGIQLAQIIAKKQHIALIGCYIAGERFDASEPTDGLWLVNQVSQQCDTCKLLLVSDNRKLVPDVRTSQVPLRFFQISSSRENAKEIEKDKKKWNLFMTLMTIVWNPVTIG
ncbi:ER membrane protein complex subunit 8/9 [Galdieria sulphuraria]|nr:ER membrane protein complex subunit 8/9 [Galdieria sulphuraria]